MFKKKIYEKTERQRQRLRDRRTEIQKDRARLVPHVFLLPSPIEREKEKNKRNKGTESQRIREWERYTETERKR